MTPLDLSIFFNDPWWIVLIKVVGVVLLLLTWTIFNVWYERRLVGKMQHRLGPIMNPTWLGGLGQALGDGMKLLFKEDFAPSMADRFLFTIAPLIAARWRSRSVIPLGGEVNMFGRMTRLQSPTCRSRPSDPRGRLRVDLRVCARRVVVALAYSLTVRCGSAR